MTGLQTNSIRLPELGVLSLALVPERSVSFRANSARSLHAALLRRIELIAPDLSGDIHDSRKGDHSTEHPVTVSPLLGLLRASGIETVAEEGRTFTARITALTSEVARILDLAFNPQHPLGQEPLILEHVPFEVTLKETSWDNLATYASLLTMAKPERRIMLDFCSPTGFSTGLKSSVQLDLTTCMSGYLRKWNAFAPIALSPEPLLAYVHDHSTLRTDSTRPAVQRLGKYSEYGFVGRVEWQIEGGSPALLRQVNALADFACYCGTGMKTALGMGQTRRIR